MSRVKALVLTGYGLNCDNETVRSLTLAGADARRVHINSLISGDVSLSGFHILVFGGGFSWGDDHGAGVVQAVRMKTHVGDAILDFVAKERLIIGICNGFQTLVNLGLLPGFDGNYQERCVALTYNDCGNFRDLWVTVAVDMQSPCVFTRGIDRLDLPVRHGEGKFYAEKPVLDRLMVEKMVVLRYARKDGSPAGGVFPENPNGSVHDIAGICDPKGRIFGLMPHPEAFHHPTHHPDWPLFQEMARRGQPVPPSLQLGTRIFQNAVSFF